MSFLNRFFGKESPQKEQELEIVKDRTGSKLIISLKGRMNALTAPELGKVVNNELEGVSELIFDLTYLEYTSSAGIRIILEAYSIIGEQGSMVLLNPGEAVTEVLEETGLKGLLEIRTDERTEK